MYNLNRVLIGFLVLLGILCVVNAQYNIINSLCRKYEKNDIDPRSCKHGARTNVCGKLECLKGAGHICGKTFQGQIRYGQCADGLMCCGICIGCDENECKTELCEPVENLLQDANLMEFK